MSGNQVILGNVFESQINLHDIETRVPISAVILTPDFSNLIEFKQLQIPDTITINKKHYIIPLAKLRIHILNLNFTFRHCEKKIGLLLNRGVAYQYKFQFCG